MQVLGMAPGLQYQAAAPGGGPGAMPLAGYQMPVLHAAGLHASYSASPVLHTVAAPPDADDGVRVERASYAPGDPVATAYGGPLADGATSSGDGAVREATSGRASSEGAACALPDTPIGTCCYADSSEVTTGTYVTADSAVTYVPVVTSLLSA